MVGFAGICSDLYLFSMPVPDMWIALILNSKERGGRGRDGGRGGGEGKEGEGQMESARGEWGRGGGEKRESEREGARERNVGLQWFLIGHMGACAPLCATQWYCQAGLHGVLCP